MLSTEDRTRLRDLAKRVKEAANSPKEMHKKEVIKKLNSLQDVTPPVFLGVTGEIMEHYMPYNKSVSMDSDHLFDGTEYWLKWRLFRSDYFDDGMPVVDTFHIGIDAHVSDWMDGYHRVLLNADKTGTKFEPCLKEFSDFKKMRKPQLTVNWQSCNDTFDKIEDVLGDILVLKKGPQFFQTIGWGESMIDQYVEMRGLEQTYFDMIDNPEFVHEVMNFMTEGHLELLEQYKQNGLLVMNNEDNHIGSSSVAFTDELEPAPGEPITEKNLWGFAEAQELSDVSPEMLEEFVLPYQAKLINKFGLSLYGCCEDISRKIPSLEKYIHNLRMVSISPLCNHEIAAENVGKKYVYAWKQHPVFLNQFDEAAIAKDLKEKLEITKNCHVAILMLDAFEFGNDFERFKKWVDLAKKAAEERG